MGTPWLHVLKGSQCPWVTWGHKKDMGTHGSMSPRVPSVHDGTWGQKRDMGTPWIHVPKGSHCPGDIRTSRICMSPRVPSVPAGHGNTLDPCPQRFPMSLGDTGTQEGHGDMQTSMSPGVPQCPGDMGTSQIHVPEGSQCPQGNMETQEGPWGHHRSMSLRVSQCPSGNVGTQEGHG